MFMINCKILMDMKKRIESGEDPEKVIPYNFNGPQEIYIEILHFALQVLPKTSSRYLSIKRKLQEYASR